MKNFKLYYLMLLIFPLLTITNMEAQRLKPGPQDLSFFSTVDETDQPYAIYIPKNFDEEKKYPLVVFLHGAMSNHRLGLRRVFGEGNIQGVDFIKPGNIPVENDLEATRYWPQLKEVNYIVAAPYARGTAGYQGIPEQDVYQMIDDIKSRFLIDEDRIYLTGLSMGGGGTLWLSLTRPDLWAAIAPVCPATPDGTQDLETNLSNIPVHLFIGDKDFLYKTALEWKAKFEAVTPRFDYIEYPGIGHNSWEYAYKDGFIFDWFSQYTRDLFPQQVKFNTRWFKYSKAYWVNFDNFTPGTIAKIDARFTGMNTIEITTDNLDAFTLRLAGHSMFDPNKKISVKIDGKPLQVKTSDGISFSKSAGTWLNKKFTPGLTSKMKDSEGPLSVALAGNHVYVYGTLDNPSQEEMATRRIQATSVADWSGMAGVIMVFPRVISDRQVRQSDYENSNLILFGTKETNAIIAKFADRLPVHLKTDVNNYGLVYIFPLNHHYVIVNSGLPWWTPAKKPDQPGITFIGSEAQSINKFKDFVLFKETSDNIIAQGSFDNNWNLPPEEGAKMKATGVIEVK